MSCHHLLVLACVLALTGRHSAELAPRTLGPDAAARFFHPLPGACFPADGAVSASVSIASGFFHSWPSELQPPHWRLLLNRRESAAGVLDAVTDDDGIPDPPCQPQTPPCTRHTSSSVLTCHCTGWSMVMTMPGLADAHYHAELVVYSLQSSHLKRSVGCTVVCVCSSPPLSSPSALPLFCTPPSRQPIFCPTNVCVSHNLFPPHSPPRSLCETEGSWHSVAAVMFCWNCVPNTTNSLLIVEPSTLTCLLVTQNMKQLNIVHDQLFRVR